MKSLAPLAVLALLAACGDNLAPAPGVLDAGFISGFDDDSNSNFFGDVQLVSPPQPNLPLAGATLCIDDSDTCTTSTPEGTFVLKGPGGEAETTVVATAPGLLPSVRPAVASITGDRNLTPMLLISQAATEGVAGAYGDDAQLDSRGALVVLAYLLSEPGGIAFSIDGATVHYLGADNLPNPAQTSLSATGGAVVFGLPPGEVVLRTSGGTCAANSDGWPGSKPGEIRLPIAAGKVTWVAPYCTAD